MFRVQGSSLAAETGQQHSAGTRRCTHCAAAPHPRLPPRLAQVLAYVLAARKAQLNAHRRRSAWGAALRSLRNCTAFMVAGQPSAGAWLEGGRAASGDLAASSDPRLRPRQYSDVRVARPSAWTDSCAPKPPCMGCLLQRLHPVRLCPAVPGCQAGWVYRVGLGVCIMHAGRQQPRASLLPGLGALCQRSSPSLGSVLFRAV